MISLLLAAKALRPTTWALLGSAAMILGLSVLLGVQTVRVAKRDTTIAELRQSISDTTANATQAARNVERLHAADIAELTAQFTKESTNAKSEFDRAIASVRANGVRKRFKCLARSTDLPATGAATTGSDGADGGGFTSADAEVAFGIADDGDTAIRRLTLCQNTVRSYVKLYTAEE